MHRIHESQEGEEVKEETMAWPIGRAPHLPGFPVFLPLARSAFAILSANRRRISSWLQLKGDDELAVELSAVNPPRCHS
jgi:hypothetical protein